jgi:hypothetical protein
VFALTALKISFKNSGGVADAWFALWQVPRLILHVSILEEVWNEAVTAQFQAPSWHLPKETKNNQTKLHSG